MKRLTLILVYLFALGVAMSWSLAATAQQCKEKKTLRVAADVFEAVPRFVTGQGWQGSVVARLPAGTVVYLCSEQDTQFGLTMKTWAQIAYRSPRGNVAYGWVLKEIFAALSIDEVFLARLSPITLARAAEPTSADNAVPWPPDGAPPQPPPQPPRTPTISPDAPPQTMISDLAVLYGPLFLVMVLGMLAKAVVDWLDHPGRASVMPHVRSGMIAILVSPIVFLGFLNAGQFSVSTQAYLVLMLLAFQNGFFWQTVLKRNDAGRGAPGKANAVDP